MFHSVSALAAAQKRETGREQRDFVKHLKLGHKSLILRYF